MLSVKLFKKLQNGQSLLEVILALAIFSMVAASLATLVVGSFRGMEQGSEQTEAEALAEEGIEAVRAVRDRAWNENTYTQSGVEVFGGGWLFSGEGTTETIGQFTRTIDFADVCRDAFDDITACPGDYIDISSKEVTVTIEWTTGVGATNSVQKVTYLTNWDTEYWIEDTSADFNDGTFTDTEMSGTMGDGDGAVILGPI